MDDLVKDRIDEIKEVIEKMRVDNNCDYTFVNMKDLDSGVSSILCADQKTRELLGLAPDILWDGMVGKSEKFTLRKQITAWISENI